MRNLTNLMAVLGLSFSLFGCGNAGESMLACQIEIMVEEMPAQLCIDFLCDGSEADCANEAAPLSCDNFVDGMANEGMTVTATQVLSCPGTKCHSSSGTSVGTAANLTANYYSGNDLGGAVCQSIADAE